MADASANDSLLADEADDHFHDECGVFGIFGRQDAAADRRARAARAAASRPGSRRHRLL